MIFPTDLTTPQSKYTGITGHRQMWPTGQPDPETLRYNIVNFRGGSNNVTQVGLSFWHHFYMFMLKLHTLGY